ncbi:hypothetical protein ACN74K_004992 [Escherichia coli]|jgi:hypothetical protein|uniref:membrane protein n=1 Tax=Escherichia coli TaxID=562 RepID=UPI00053A14E8|nr:membrane protein [Escherichia coli]HDQ6573461.1 hypothetical protein [Escherichia coli O128:H2]HDQ6609929.1 hypothetical protein [Escherichia coli Ou:H21]HDQ6879450.1 hypothetical protein [Escherichia coli O174:H8]HDQ6951051.1 hypothetical protein [Escherichia coli Ou:H8]EEC8144414.1 hypothetical protein [Escherichia coli]
MVVNSNGSDNRVAGRDYHEKNIQIERYDGRHTVNIAIPSNRTDERPLVKAQRRQLNLLIDNIVDVSKEESFVVWRKLHAEIGVDSIDNMTVNQYPTAVSFLNAMLDRYKDHDACKSLVSLLLRNSENNEVRQKLLRYCHINFGTGRLNDLTRSQLQMALSWLDQQSVEGEKKLTANNSAGSQLQMNFQQIIKKYPKETGMCFVIGVLLGIILF